MNSLKYSIRLNKGYKIHQKPQFQGQVVCLYHRLLVNLPSLRLHRWQRPRLQHQPHQKPSQWSTYFCKVEKLCQDQSQKKRNRNKRLAKNSKSSQSNQKSPSNKKRGRKKEERMRKTKINKIPSDNIFYNNTFLNFNHKLFTISVYWISFSIFRMFRKDI